MERKGNPALVPLAREGRKNATKEERRLWYEFLRGYEVRFARQKILGHYIVDFYCAAAKLAVELDGSQHYQGQGPEKDAERTAFLEGYGIKVLRIPNNWLQEDFEAVCRKIDAEVKGRMRQR